jgi:hypothetical protein
MGWGTDLHVPQFNTNLHKICNILISVNNVAIYCLTMKELPQKHVCYKLTQKKEHSMHYFRNISCFLSHVLVAATKQLPAMTSQWCAGRATVRNRCHIAIMELRK